MKEMQIQQWLFSEYASRSAAIIPNFTPARWYECDLFQVTRSLYWVEFEIKISVADFRADFRKGYKHRDLANGGPKIPRRFWYVMPVEIADKVQDEIPEYAGLIAVDGAAQYSNQLLQTRIKAPTLKSQKISERQLQRLYERFYWRYWYQRQRIIEGDYVWCSEACRDKGAD
jgi:hypothetical protein